MTFPLILTLLIIPCVGAAAVLLVRRLTAPGAISECDPEWVANFSLAAYRPMLRLLSEADYKYFAAQRGVPASAVRKFRRERRRIFRSYLRSLVKDFHRLHLAARMTLIYSPEDRPDLAQTLLRQRAMFAWAVLVVEFRLAMHTFGIGVVDVSRLVGALDMMRSNIGSLAVSPSAAM